MEPTYTKADVQALLDAFEERLVRRLRVEMMAADLGDDRLVDDVTVAMLLGISVRSVHRLRRLEEIRGAKVGGAWRISLGELRMYCRAVAEGHSVRLT